MPAFQLFQVSQKGVLMRDGKVLIVEFADAPGLWDLPGGRIDEGEMADAAFMREFSEEVGFDDVTPGTVIDYDTLYKGDGHMSGTIMGIIRWIDTPHTEVQLSFEHSNFAWIGKEEIERYEFVWPNMKRALYKAFEEAGR